MKIDPEKFINAMQNNSLELKAFEPRLRELVSLAFSRCSRKYGKQLKPDDAETLLRDLQQLVWERLLEDIKSDKRDTYLRKDIEKHIFVCAKAEVEGIFSKRITNRAQVLTKTEASQIRERIWGKGAGSKKRPYRSDAFISLDANPETVGDLTEGEEGLASDAELLDVIERSVAKLPNGQQELFLLWNEGVKQAEIGQKLGVSERTVRNRLDKLFSNIRNLINDDDRYS